MKKLQKNLPMAQMTRLASFGLVLVVAGLPDTYFVDYNCIFG
jgi:hypothetical protein